MHRFYFLFASLTILSACSSTHLKKASVSNQQDKRHITGVNLKTVSSLEKITDKLSQHRSVFVGETHNNYSHHLNQLAVIKGLHKHWGKNTSIGLEMVQTPYQSFLNQYVSGVINEKEMLRGIQWYQRWKFDFRLYRPIFEYAKQHRIPLVALNIPKELTKRISKVGIKGLSQQERKQLPPVIDRSNKAYIKRITSVFKGHAHTSSNNADKFIDAQLGWDEGMAFSVAKYLLKHPEKRMIILAGSGHVVGYQGIPDRLDRQIESKSAVVLNYVEDDADIKIENSGDFLLLSSEVKLPPKVQLGIAMEDANSGVKIIRIVPRSSAHRAGLKVEDIILKLNETLITDSLDLKLALEEIKVGSKIKLKIKRHEKIVFNEVTLRSK